MEDLPKNVQLRILYHLPPYHLAHFTNKHLWEIYTSTKFCRWDPSIDWFYKMVSPRHLRLKHKLYIMTLSDIYSKLYNPVVTEPNTVVSLEELNEGFFWKCNNEEVSDQCKPFQIVNMGNKTGIMTLHDSFSEIAMPDTMNHLISNTITLINFSYDFHENEDGYH